MTHLNMKICFFLVNPVVMMSLFQFPVPIEAYLCLSIYLSKDVKNIGHFIEHILKLIEIEIDYMNISLDHRVAWHSRVFSEDGAEL